MHIMDIHSHILPGIDDGSKSEEESIALLEIMAKQGITDVVATPHFDASFQSIEDFFEQRQDAKLRLDRAIGDNNLPKVHLGCEVYYFKGIGKSNGIKALCLGNSKYILLELRETAVDSDILNDVKGIIDDIGLVPIFAHIERYANLKGFKEILKLIDNGQGYGQINAHSVISPPFKRTAHKLIKKGYVSFIATDTHSLKARPPYWEAAINEIGKSFGKDYAETFIKNTDFLCGKVMNV